MIKKPYKRHSKLAKTVGCPGQPGAPKGELEQNLRRLKKDKLRDSTNLMLEFEMMMSSIMKTQSGPYADD